MLLYQYFFTFTEKFLYLNIISLTCLLIFTVPCLRFCWLYWRLIRSFKKFPSHRLDIEIFYRIAFGLFRQDIPFSSALLHLVLETSKRFEKEGFYVLWFFTPILIIFNDEFFKRFYSESSIANKSALYDRFMKETFGNGLLTSNSDVWRKHRKLLNPAFSLGMLKGKISIMNEQAADLVRILEGVVDRPTTDLPDFLKRCSFNVMAESILGLKLNDKKYGSKIEKFVEAIEEVNFSIAYRVARPWLYWSPVLSLFPSGRRYLKSVAYLRSFTHEILSEMKNSSFAASTVAGDVDINAENKKSFARILLEQHLKDPTFTIKDVEDEVATIMFAGYDTTAHALMWCLYMLGSHPEVQKRAFIEIEELKDRDVTYEDLCDLKYLDCVIKETQRLYSTVPAFIRKLDKDVKCGNYTIPKGTEVDFLLFLLHRNPNIYPNPEVFDPERFSENSNIHPWTFMPFAEGYRSCIGKKFALMELKILLVHILRRLEIKTLDKVEDAGLDWQIILKTVKHVRMLFTLRS